MRESTTSTSPTSSSTRSSISSLPVQLRTARPSDLEILQEFQQHLVVHERPMDAGIPEEGMVEYYDLASLISSDQAHVLVAEIEGGNNGEDLRGDQGEGVEERHSTIIGCGFGEVRENVPWAIEKWFGYLGLMYVAEPYRRQGIGRSIADAIIRWFAERGITHIVTQAYAANVHAVDAYRTYGFRDFVMEMRYDPKES